MTKESNLADYRKIFESVWKRNQILEYANNETNQTYANVVEAMNFGGNRTVVLFSIIGVEGDKYFEALAFDFDTTSEHYVNWNYGIVPLDENQIPAKWLTRQNIEEGDLKGNK